MLYMLSVKNAKPYSSIKPKRKELNCRDTLAYNTTALINSQKSLIVETLCYTMTNGLATIALNMCLMSLIVDTLSYSCL
jgi:hypothetical protein